MAELKECARLVESVAEQLDARCQTWKETLDRAYKDGRYNQNTGLWETDECKVSRARYTLDAYRDALSMVDTLGQQIDELLRRPSPSTAPLTLENGFEIANADGTPIDYEALGRKYKNQLCYCDIDGFYVGEDGQLVLMDDCGTAVSVDRGDYRIKARKPEENAK